MIFALGVATGIVQEFEFGMNWANYSRFVGNVFGSLLAAEGIFAFFLEGGFLGLMLFGGNRLGPRMWFDRDLPRGVRCAFQRAVDYHGQLVDADPGGLYGTIPTGAGASGDDQFQPDGFHAVVSPAYLACLVRLVDGGFGARAQRQRVVFAEETVHRCGESESPCGADLLCHL